FRIVLTYEPNLRNVATATRFCSAEYTTLIQASRKDTENCPDPLLAFNPEVPETLEFPGLSSRDDRI
ncbi:hypothetical protein, partial [Changpingibacter yushuensis]|uniref:hypothetical protein n=1 Tax=Changpingibacter yushuensis TaxID=2758440 RepID=UPI001CB70993